MLLSLAILFFALFMLGNSQFEQWQRSQPRPTAPALPTLTPTATPTAVSTTTPTATAIPSPTSTPTPRVYTEPVRLKIPSISVDAPIIKVGLLPDGELEAPKEGHEVGWFEKGIRPGMKGNALLDGHVDWRREIAVFWDLRKMKSGEEISIITANGEDLRFEVEWLDLVEAANPPLERIFGQTSYPAVTIITCGGEFDRSIHDYTHRWVVRAKLVS